MHAFVADRLDNQGMFRDELVSSFLASSSYLVLVCVAPFLLHMVLLVHTFLSLSLSHTHRHPLFVAYGAVGSYLSFTPINTQFKHLDMACSVSSHMIFVIPAIAAEFEACMTGRDGVVLSIKQRIAAAIALGVRFLVVVLSKQDDAAVLWNQALFEKQSKDLQTCFQKLGVPADRTRIVPTGRHTNLISGKEPLPADAQHAAKLAWIQADHPREFAWYKGESLLEVLLSTPVPAPPAAVLALPPAVAITQIHHCGGSGTVVEGRVLQGCVMCVCECVSV
jgi:translation elongation factor EF-1alpha